MRAALSLALLVVMVFVLDTRWKSVPPVGSFLSPFGGIWSRKPSPFDEAAKFREFNLNGLKGRVTIQVDEDQIKHVFAENDEDLYFAQGWILASERLFQMEFLTRLAAGRLSEMVGRRGLDYDRLFRKLGIPEAAKESAELMLQDPVTRLALTSYSAGVNAYLATLPPARIPFEFKLLGFQPSPWAPERAALLLKFMAYNLSGYSQDLPLTRSREALNRADFDDLFPLSLPNPEPIVPKGTHWSFANPVAVPKTPAKEFLPDLGKLARFPKPDPSNGSNNWAVMGKKSTTGRPILSNDIHLGLTLPALWYEMQLVSPTQNVYGITLPGAPGIILGFNQKVAWGVTNGDTDILDWFELRYRDEKRAEYHFDGQWRPVVSTEAEIKIRGEPSEHLTLRRTHLGPIVYDDSEIPIDPRIPRGLAMRWGALEGTNELKTFLLLNRAKSTADCRAAIETYNTPDQNFLCADNGGDVGLWHMGKYPVRWPGQGRMISDGSSSDWDWKGWIPRDQVPFTHNPERGFLSSANQNPTDENYPYYLGWTYEGPFRALRINELLREKAKLSPEDLIQMQGDKLSVLARMVRPSLLKALEGANPRDLGSQAERAIALVTQWDDRYTETSTAATIFDTWYKKLVERIWSPHFPDPIDYSYPPALRTIALITREPQSKWFDDPNTPEHETLTEVARASFRDALAEIADKMGRNPDRWEWAKFRPTHFDHLGHIPGLDRQDFRAGGAAATVFANKGNHGPVWKLVVALGARPKAWGIYPGGQNGDPTSRNYDNFLEAWGKNDLKELVFLLSDAETSPRLLKRVTLEPSAANQPKAGL